MRETLLVIDGRGQPETLLGSLERAGFFCVYARGPLKAKALLKEHPVALILWKDNTGNADLSRDLARVWKAHPHVPVIHLYAREPYAESAELGGQVRISLPVEAADGQLLAFIEQTLEGLKPPPPSELHVLGAASRRQLSAEELPDYTVCASRQALGDPAVGLTPHTGLSADERASLFGAAGGVSASRLAAGWRWFRHALSRIRPQLESGGR